MTHRLVALTYHTPPQGISPLRMRDHQELLREGERRGLFQLLGAAGGEPAIRSRAKISRTVPVRNLRLLRSEYRRCVHFIWTQRLIAQAPAASGAALIAFLARDPLLAGGLASYHFTAGAGPKGALPPCGRLRKGA